LDSESRGREETEERLLKQAQHKVSEVHKMIVEEKMEREQSEDKL